MAHIVHLYNRRNMENKLSEEEIVLNRVFDRYVKRYQKENESVVYELGVSLMLTMNFLMTAYLVVTVMNN
jgi:hypothetical protein